MKSKLFLLLLPLLLLVSGCAVRESLQIEGEDWQLKLIQSNADGSILARGPGREAYADVPEAEVSCRAEKGKIIIKDAADVFSAEGMYYLQQKQQDSAIYRLRLDGEESLAGLSFTSYADGSREKTLVIRREAYSIYFTASAESN